MTIINQLKKDWKVPLWFWVRGYYSHLIMQELAHANVFNTSETAFLLRNLRGVGEREGGGDVEDCITCYTGKKKDKSVHWACTHKELVREGLYHKRGFLPQCFFRIWFMLRYSHNVLQRTCSVASFAPWLFIMEDCWGELGWFFCPFLVKFSVLFNQLSHWNQWSQIEINVNQEDFDFPRNLILVSWWSLLRWWIIGRRLKFQLEDSRTWMSGSFGFIVKSMASYLIDIPSIHHFQQFHFIWKSKVLRKVSVLDSCWCSGNWILATGCKEETLVAKFRHLGASSHPKFGFYVWKSWMYLGCSLGILKMYIILFTLGPNK